MPGATSASITVVIPAYRAGATIGRTLDSLARQTRPDWQAIVVDDGSPDETASIVRARASADPRIRLHVQRNAGAAAARRVGIDAAASAWLLFLDADDTIRPDHLRRMLARAAAEPASGAVVSGHARVDRQGRSLIETPAPRLDLEPLALCRSGPPAAIHAFIVRTDRVREAGGFDTGLETNEDWALWLALAQSGMRFAREDAILADYWPSPTSLTRKAPAMMRDMAVVLRRAGQPEEAIAHLLFDALLWLGGSRLAAGEPIGDLVDAAPPVALPGDLTRSVEALMEGLVIGSDRPHAALAAAWPGFAADLTALLGAVALRAGRPGLAGNLCRLAEREAIRVAPPARELRVGDSLALAWRPSMLWRGLRPEPGAERIIVRAAHLRPRSRFMAGFDAARGASGREVCAAVLAALGGQRLAS